MPFKSKAQQRYMHAHAKELSKQGVDLKEWDSATDFSNLLERKSKPKKFSHGSKKR